MLWLKFVLGVLIVAFCTLLGWLFSNKYRVRKKFFTQLSSFNERYLAELKFSRKPLPVFLSESHFTGEFETLIGEFSKSHTTKITANFLTQTEKDYISEYLTMLGKGDSHSQSGYFTAQADFLSEKKNGSEKEAKSYSELSVKLGLLAGLAFVILII